MEAWITKNSDGYLVPADEESRERLQQIKYGEVIKIKYTKARDYQYHKKFFDFLRVTFDMQEFFDTPEHYRRWITMKAGWYDTISTPNGKTIFVARSISFGKMEDDEFHKLFSTCIDVFLKELGTGITEEDLLQVIGYS